MSSAQHCNQKIFQVSKVKNVDTQNSANEQLQFNENFNQITLKTNEFLRESDFLMNNQKEFFTTSEEQFQKAHEKIIT